MKDNIIVFIVAIAFLYAGIKCSFKPYKIQKDVLAYYAAHENLKKFNPLLPWMGTSNYILALRVIGIIGFLGFSLILYAIIYDIVK